jgi:hypothetical protein
MSQVLDIRTYKIVPGRRDEFDRIVREGTVPMLHHFGIKVVGFGPSIVDDDHYYLMRAFPSASRRKEQLESFYGSAEWEQTYEDVVMGLIEAYHTVVVELTLSIGEALTQPTLEAAS